MPALLPVLLTLLTAAQRPGRIDIPDLEAFEQSERMKNRDTHFVHADGDMTPEMLMQVCVTTRTWC